MGTVTKTVGTASRDFSTLQAWEDSLPANLVTDGNSQVADVYNDSEFTGTNRLLFISGETTDATHTITVKAAAGQGFADNASVQSNALKYNVSNGVGIRITGSYTSAAIEVASTVGFVTIKGLQVKIDGNPYTGAIKSFGPSATINGCIVDARASTRSTTAGGITLGNSSAGTAIVNTLVIAGGESAIVFGNTGPMTVANCTLVKASDATSFGSQDGIYVPGNYGTANKIINTACFGFAKVVENNTFFSGGGNNCTDLAGTTVPGSSNQVSKTYASQFQAVAAATMDFRVKSGAALIDNAATDSTDVPSGLDIAGTTRPSGSAWDIGAWELVDAAAPPSGPVGLVGLATADF